MNPYRILRFALVVSLGVTLAGCAAMPASVRMASWAIDGVSYLTTKKSVVDHGLSLANGQDCATLRLLTEGQACRDTTPGVDFNTDLSPKAQSGLAAATLCNVEKMSSALPNTEHLDQCAARLVERFGKDGAKTACDERIAQLVDELKTDDAAVWMGVQVAVNHVPAEPPKAPAKPNRLRLRD